MSMKKLFISADIEGTSGIAHWDETEKGKADYAYFAKQMTREVSAVCEGALEGGYGEIVIKDAHDSARNIDPSGIPEAARVLRGWARHPYCMMYGIDESFAGAAFTGYHSAAQWPTNPLSHTMTGSVNYVKINGELASELMMNCLCASYENVPIVLVSGDKGLCDWIKTKLPELSVVPTNEGVGGSALGKHPNVTVRELKAAVRGAKGYMYPMPEHFVAEINYKEHPAAYRAGFYPGAEQIDARTVKFEADDYMDVLKFFMFDL